MRKIVTPLLIILCSFVQAQTGTKDEAIFIKSLSVSIKANLITASTILDIELQNPNHKILDGELNFALQDGQSITGFALDINGKMRNGVVVEKQKARIAYENTIRRKVDPGLLEMTGGNNYRIRVYPMPSQGSRKISITIQQQLKLSDNKLDYYFPLEFENKIEVINIDALIKGGTGMPQTKSGLLESVSFIKDGNQHQLHYKANNITANRPLSFSIPLIEDSVNCIDHENYFVSRVKLPQTPVTGRLIKSTTVFWDESSSAAKRDLQKELKFLEAYIEKFRPEVLQIVCFSNALHKTISFPNPAGKVKTVINFLRDQENDGGTQLGVLDCSKYNSDEFLLFSDGLSNFGDDQIHLINKPVYTLQSSASANSSILKFIAKQSSGKYINLLDQSSEEAVENIIHADWLLKNITFSGGLSETIYLISDNHLFIAGKTNGGEQKIEYSIRSGEIEKAENVLIRKTEECDSVLAKNAWILLQFHEMQGPYTNGQALTEFAKKYEIVTQSTSLIILDNLEDYFIYDIMPPEDLLDEYNRQFSVKKELDKQKKKDIKTREIEILQGASSAYNKRIQWWDKNHPIINLAKVERKKEIQPVAVDDVQVNNSNSGNENNENFFKLGSASLDEVVVVGYATQRRMNLTGSASMISGESLTSSGNVLQALQGRVAGLVVYRAEGQPGSTYHVRIRGAMGDPLYILDGIPVDFSLVSSLNTFDIESITVYKDASQIARFSGQGANGVIVINTKRGQQSFAKPGVPQYKNMDDIEYIMELKEVEKELKYDRYMQMKKTELGEEASFYFDVAEHFFAAGLKNESIRVLSNLSELNLENHQLLRAMGYMFESWGDYKNAISVYTKVLSIKEEEPQSYRDLALAFDKNGDHQKAIDLLYKVLTKDWLMYERRYAGLRETILNELNAIIALHKEELNLSEIVEEVIMPLPVDIRIVIDWNKDETDIDLHIIEPDGEECFYSHKETKNGGRLSADLTQGYGPEEYEIHHAKKGLYKIQVDYYGDQYQKKQVPSFVKLTIYKNYGKPNQSMTVQSLIMEGQRGKIEIDDVKY